MAKNKHDISIIVNIVFMALFIGAAVFLYMILGKNNFETLKKETKNAYEDRLQELPKTVKEEVKKTEELPPFHKYKFEYSYNIDVQGYTKNMNIVIPIPHDENEKQYISDLKITPNPSKLYNDGINTLAEFHIESIEDHNFTIKLEGSASTRTYNLKTAKLINKNLTPENDLTKYLQPEHLIESNDSMIVNIAKKIKGNTKEEIVQKIYEYAQDHIEYKPIPGALGAKRTLTEKVGKCTEFTAVMVALCRAKGIPARVVIGNIARDNGTQHAWAEVYYDEYGWVMYDPTARATVVKILDAAGKLVKTEKRYETSVDLKYILSGRNLFNQFRMNYSTGSSKNGTARVQEKVVITPIEE